MAPPYKILIINPNSTQLMTDALQPLVEQLGFNSTTYTYFTGPPSAPASINGPDDAAASAEACLPALSPLLGAHDAALVACYSHHPLVAALRPRVPACTGILEASVSAALAVLGPGARFGIVSTGQVWEEALGRAVDDLLGARQPAVGAGWTGPQSRAFAGVETTGLSAVELHEAPQAEVRRRVQAAVGRLVGRGGVTCVLLGCAGMAGMEEWVREVVGPKVWVVDGVRAGVSVLQGLLRGGF